MPPCCKYWVSEKLLDMFFSPDGICQSSVETKNNAQCICKPINDGNPSPVANRSKGACLSSCCPIDPTALQKKSTEAKKHEIYKIGPY